MLQTYPDIILPLPRLDEFSESAEPSIARSQMEGKPNQRRRYHGETLTQSAEWSFSEYEWWAFQAFVFHKLHSGADWFTMELPGEDGLTTVLRARFVEGKYESRFANERWMVSAMLEVREERPNA